MFIKRCDILYVAFSKLEPSFVFQKYTALFRCLLCIYHGMFWRVVE